MMPRHLVLVRHGESEGNVANRRSRQGDNSAFTDAFRNRHSSQWRLTDRGREQAIAAGAWIRANYPEGFGRKYSSEYLRAMETAAMLGLPGNWYVDFYLRERDWGQLDVMTDEERHARFADELRRRDIDSFFWAPPGGESMAHLCLRVDRVLNTLHRECSDTDVLTVCHGEVMWAFRVRLERMPQRIYRDLEASDHPWNHIHNGQILEYSRIDPETGEEHSHMEWVRSTCPWDDDRSWNRWERIKRPKLTSDMLLAEVERTTRILAG